MNSKVTQQKKMSTEINDSTSTNNVLIDDNNVPSHALLEDEEKLKDRYHDNEQQQHQQKTSSSSAMSTIHYLPCKINYNGPTDVNNYFQITKTNDKQIQQHGSHNHQNYELKSTFRGRELIGKEVILPANIIGIHAVQHPPREKNEMTWEVVGGYDKITMWQHDIAPDLSTLNHAIEWFDIANEVR